MALRHCGEYSRAFFASELSIYPVRRMQCSITKDASKMMGGNNFCPHRGRIAISSCSLSSQPLNRDLALASRPWIRFLVLQNHTKTKGRRDLRNDVGPSNQPPMLVNSPTQSYFLSYFCAGGTRQLNLSSVFLDVHDLGACGG